MECPRHLLILLIVLLARIVLLQQPPLHLPAYLISTQIDTLNINLGGIGKPAF